LNVWLCYKFINTFSTPKHFQQTHQHFSSFEPENLSFESTPPSPCKLLFAKISGEANFTVPLELDEASKNLSINGLFPCKLAVASAKDLLKQDF
jgi:hypothetical protein